MGTKTQTPWRRNIICGERELPMSGLRFILKKRWLFRELLHSSPPANSGLYKDDVMLHCIVLLCHFSLGTDVRCQIVKIVNNGLSISHKLLKPGREDCEAGRWCQADSSELLALKYGTFRDASIVPCISEVSRYLNPMICCQARECYQWWVRGGWIHVLVSGCTVSGL